MTPHEYHCRGICGSEANPLWVVGSSSGKVKLHLNVLIQDSQQQKVVCAKLWNCFPQEAISHTCIDQRDIRRTYSSTLVTPRGSFWRTIIRHNLAVCFQVMKQQVPRICRHIVIPETVMSIDVPTDEAWLFWSIIDP